MLKGLSKAGLGDVGDLMNFVQLTSKYKFEAIDIDGSSLIEMISSIGLERAKQFFQDHNVQIATFGLSVEWRKSEEEFIKGIKQLVLDAEAASALGCNSCTTYILPSTDYNAAQFMALATRRLRTCAQILGSYGIKLGLEFVGPHHLRTMWENPFIWTMEQTLDFIDAIGEKNVGLLVDAYHCYTTGVNYKDLTKLDVNQIVHVHINDAKAVPIEEVLDNDRLYPGEGVIDLVGFLQALKEIGYVGPVSQEVLTQQVLPESTELLLEKSAQAYATLYRAAGIE
ncbi:sugar phosphate isomerase/epimerase family protein [Halalkalibacter kiskunsagensis]|uniref:Sugar phosphate isomerase/epimerase family protein n=1 Tax=Halalkalibacter kiskunsagensis TaxID=1548599 RepID=A0ABV6K7E1_9BACI